MKIYTRRLKKRCDFRVEQKCTSHTFVPLLSRSRSNPQKNSKSFSTEILNLLLPLALLTETTIKNYENEDEGGRRV